MKNIFLFVLMVTGGVLSLGGCSTTTESNMYNDWRTGTDQTPYRTIPPAIQCDDCRY